MAFLRTVLTVALVAGLSGWLGEAQANRLGQSLAFRKINKQLSGSPDKDMALLERLASESGERGLLESDVRPYLAKLVELKRATDGRDCSDASFELAKSCELQIGPSKVHRAPKRPIERLARTLIETYVDRCGLSRRQPLMLALSGAPIAHSDRAKVRRFGDLVYTRSWEKVSKLLGQNIPQSKAFYKFLTRRKVDTYHIGKETFYVADELGEQFKDPAWSDELTSHSLESDYKQLRQNLRDLFRRQIVEPCQRLVEARGVRAAGERAVFGLRYTYAQADYSDKEFMNAVKDYHACSLLLGGQAEGLGEQVLAYYDG